MEMPKPTEAHKRMEALAGKWTGPEIIHPSPWAPEGGKAQGHSVNRMALSGMVVINEYEQEKEGKVQFTGHGVSTYNLQEQCYVMYWFDCMGMPPQIYKGNFEGDVLTLVAEDSIPGAPRYSRLVYDLGQDGALGCRMETSNDGEQWDLQVESTYRRAG